MSFEKSLFFSANQSLYLRTISLRTETAIIGVIFPVLKGMKCLLFSSFNKFHNLYPFRPLPQTIQEKYIRVINILTQNMSRKPASDKSQAIPKSGQQLVVCESEDKSFDADQLESLFELKHNYSDVNNIIKSKRQSLLSRSWCVSILSHLIWSLNDFFITSEQNC